MIIVTEYAALTAPLKSMLRIEKKLAKNKQKVILYKNSEYEFGPSK